MTLKSRYCGDHWVSLGVGSSKSAMIAYLPIRALGHCPGNIGNDHEHLKVRHFATQFV